jgi:hypothetical protein
LLGNDGETNNYTTARKQQQRKGISCVVRAEMLQAGLLVESVDLSEVKIWLVGE